MIPANIVEAEVDEAAPSTLAKIGWMFSGPPLTSEIPIARIIPQSRALVRNACRLAAAEPGTGKTFTASVIAAELDLPLYTIQMDKVVTKFMGETSTKLRQIFDNISTSTGVYFFDEFDAIGADRSLDNEVGEARRILNSFLQFIEQDTSDSIIIAATNNQKLLDQALFRRFDDVLHYAMPTSDEVRRLFEIRLGTFDSSFKVSDETIRMASKLSHAEIIRVCDDAIKNSILMNTKIDNVYLLKMLKDRINAYIAKEA